MYSLLSLLSGIYPFLAMHSLHVTIKKQTYTTVTIYQGVQITHFNNTIQNQDFLKIRFQMVQFSKDRAIALVPTI